MIPLAQAPTESPKLDAQLRDLASKVKASMDAVLNGQMPLGQLESWLRTYAQRAQDLRSERSEPSCSPAGASHEEQTWASSQAVVDWCHKQQLTLDKHSYWWTLPSEPTGHIRGLDNSHGTARITNGIDVWIERADGSLFKGHLAWFIKDKKPRAQREAKESPTSILLKQLQEQLKQMQNEHQNQTGIQV